MRQLAERSWFHLCLILGRLLRRGKYSATRVVAVGSDCHVQKRRVFYAPALVWLAGWLYRMLETGVRVLTQREWEQRERLLYKQLYDMSIETHERGTLVLPCLAGSTLAALLDDQQSNRSIRETAIECTVVALVAMHQQGVTHGDAMAENVLVDLDAGVARWIDFENLHDSGRSMVWRRADDVRALLATCLLRTTREHRAETIARALDVYADVDVTRLMTEQFTTRVRRPLLFHLGQAPWSWREYQEIGAWLREYRPSLPTPAARREG